MLIALAALLLQAFSASLKREPVNPAKMTSADPITSKGRQRVGASEDDMIVRSGSVRGSAGEGNHDVR